MKLSRKQRKQERWEFYDIIMRTMKSREGLYEMTVWLERSDFFTAPAGMKHHGAYKGGLLHHSLNVYHRLAEKVEQSGEDISPASVATVALLHDVCKADFYREDGKGGYYVVNRFPMGHGEKSAWLVGRLMDLTPDEALAIRWHMGQWDDAAKGGSRDYLQAMKIPLVRMLHEADKEAAEAERLEEETKE